PWVNGFIVKEASPIASNFRASTTLDDYLKAHGIVGLQGIDTRALTRHLRDHGAQDGSIASVETDPARLLERVRALPGLVGRDLVAEVTTGAPFAWPEGGWALGRGWVAPPPPRFRVVAYDCGVKWNILRQLRMAGCEVT
ncbi:MAG TPA: carbamoyl phosphate synthase small subunit, partial [Candidatus Rokubacteria bacterium]|nr:carbamoyl phosphate synthase small subunit [Candidatus Rokubacteria bacterium]